MILRITEAEVVGRHSLRLAFNDGTRMVVEVRPLLEGPVFEPLKDPKVFAQFKVDPDVHTLVWLNGADLAPEFLHQQARVPA